MQPDLHPSSSAARALQHFHQHPPLIHCMTNDVVQTFTANVLLAPGTSPAMVIDSQEAAPFAAIADVLDNVASACLWMKRAGQTATQNSKGPGSFIPAFLDTLYGLAEEMHG